jgi:quinoprotein glucose dehydrogenase
VESVAGRGIVIARKAGLRGGKREGRPAPSLVAAALARRLAAIMLFAALPTCAQQARAQASAQPTVYGEYLGRDQFSSLGRISTANVRRLTLAWTYDIGETGRRFEATPIVVDGVMYFPTPESKVIAVDAITGRRLWEYNPHVEYSRDRSRGVAYWPGAPHMPARILLGTADGRLIALDPKSGRLVRSFGNEGVVNVRRRALKSFPRSPFWYSSAPSVWHDAMVVAPALQEGPSHGATDGGDPRAFDIITGKQLWQFHTLPHPGELGADTWFGPQSLTDRSGPSAWVPIAVDDTRGLVFVTTGNPADSFYGADRHGKDLFANSVVAVDARTGRMRWYFQMVHHEVWDYDGVDTAVIEVHRGGATIPAIAAIAKSGHLFILSELTGRPLFDVSEKPVPQSDVPGEQSWPTQPFPVAPPALTRERMSTADLTTVSSQSARYCRELWSHYHNDGPFTPIGLTPTVSFPSVIGGAQWDSLSFDPELGYLFVNTSELGSLGQMQRVSSAAHAKYSMAYKNVGGPTLFVDPDGYPCQKPPWGLLAAINVSTGKIVWKVPLGDYGRIQESGSFSPPLTSLPEGPGRDLVQTSCSRCHGIAAVLQPRMTRRGWTSVVDGMIGNGLRVTDSQKQAIVNYLTAFLGKSPASRTHSTQPAASTTFTASQEPTGTPNTGGSLSTAGNLVFIGSTLDDRFRAFDALTGRQLWSYQLDGVGLSTPMSFLGTDGKQYVVIASGALSAGVFRTLHNDALNSPEKIFAFTLEH